VLMKTTLTPTLVHPLVRARRAAQGKRTALLAVVDGVTPGFRAAAERVRRLLGPRVTDSDGGQEESRPHARSTSDVLVGGPNMRFYHRAGCPMTADRDWSAASLGEQDRTGRAPCGMCAP